MLFTENNTDIHAVMSKTLGFYERHAQTFWMATKQQDVSYQRQQLLSVLPKDKGLKILDFGCGAGRDLSFFAQLGYEVTGLDGCKTFCDMARSFSGCPVWHQEFDQLVLPKNTFDTVFANASLFHVPSAYLPVVLSHLYQTLTPSGILYIANPTGQFEGMHLERYGFFMALNELKSYVIENHFQLISHQEWRSKQSGRPWVSVVCRKTS